jgi:hypothetical protein
MLFFHSDRFSGSAHCGDPINAGNSLFGRFRHFAPRRLTNGRSGSVCRRYSRSALIREILRVLCVVFRYRAYAHVVRRVGASVTKAGHYVLASVGPPLFPLAARLPNSEPFLERHQEGNATFPRVAPVAVEGNPLWVGFLPFKCIAQHRQTVSISLSHWLLLLRTVVRDGIGASTSMPFRLYHARVEL